MASRETTSAGPSALAATWPSLARNGAIAPPTKVQNPFFASFPGKKGEVNAIDDAELMGLDHHALDQRAEDLATRIPIGLVKVIRHGFRKAVQARQRLAQHGLF